MLRDPPQPTPDSPEATRSLSLHSEEGGTGWPKASWKRPLIISNEGSTGTLTPCRVVRCLKLIQSACVFPFVQHAIFSVRRGRAARRDVSEAYELLVEQLESGTS